MVILCFRNDWNQMTYYIYTLRVQIHVITSYGSLRAHLYNCTCNKKNIITIFWKLLIILQYLAFENKSLLVRGYILRNEWYDTVHCKTVHSKKTAWLNLVCTNVNHHALFRKRNENVWYGASQPNEETGNLCNLYFNDMQKMTSLFKYFYSNGKAIILGTFSTS